MRAGAGGGIVAALVMAVSPIVVLLDRGNISDTLLILLLAGCCTPATTTVTAILRKAGVPMPHLHRTWRLLAPRKGPNGIAVFPPPRRATMMATPIAAPATNPMNRAGTTAAPR